MRAQPIVLGGEAWLADLSGVLYAPAHATLVVADLHLEKGSGFTRRGLTLPPHDSRATLERLAEAVAHYAPRRIVALGDSFHDARAADRLAGEDRALLARIAAGREMVWILGNHDPEIPAGLAGERSADWRVGAVVLKHHPGGAGAWIAGHLHPKARVPTRGGTIRARCFVVDGQRGVLPAFGAYAGGLDVRDPALWGLFPDRFHAVILGRQRVHRLACDRLG